MNDVNINIFGREYNLALTDASEAEVRDLSDSLNKLFYTNAKKHRNVDPVNISILTALSLMKDNFKLRKKLFSSSIV